MKETDFTRILINFQYKEMLLRAENRKSKIDAFLRQVPFIEIEIPSQFIYLGRLVSLKNVLRSILD